MREETAVVGVKPHIGGGGRLRCMSSGTTQSAVLWELNAAGYRFGSVGHNYRRGLDLTVFKGPTCTLFKKAFASGLERNGLFSREFSSDLP